jgi:hypothetical protein
MAGQPLIATITGIPNLIDVNVRSGPSRDFQPVFKSAKGTTGLRVIEVQIDGKGESLQGKVYQWFRLQFPDGQIGWVRDDLITVVGDGAQFGYGIFTAPAVPFYVLRTSNTNTGASGSMTAQPTQVAAQPVVVQPSPTVTVTTPTTLPSPTSAGTSTQVTVQTVQTPPSATPQATVATPQATVGTPQVTVSAPQQKGPASIICMNRGGANLRPGPGAKMEPVLARINYRETAPILEVKQGEPNDYFKWIKVRYQGKEAWVREDFTRLTGTFGQFGYNEDAYPSPVPDSHWSRDYDETGQVSGIVHHGWDHSGTTGATVQAGPKGGVVTKTMLCQSCGPEGASTVDKGFTLSDSRVLSNPSWNYGYGHYVIVRYDNALLPASTHNYLGTKGWSGYHAFVMYAHLHKILCSDGQSLGPSQELGKMGNSGNSSGTHLHLELRFGKDANSQWANIRNGLVSPAHLFLR